MKYSVRLANIQDFPLIMESYEDDIAAKESIYSNRINHILNSKEDYIWIAVSETGEVAGLRAAMHFDAVYNNDVIKATQFGLTRVHSAHRRKGLFTRLTKSSIDYITKLNYDIIFNISTKMSKPGYQKLGWNYVDGFRRLSTYILRPKGKEHLRVLDKSDFYDNQILQKHIIPNNCFAALNQSTNRFLELPGYHELVAIIGYETIGILKVIRNEDLHVSGLMIGDIWHTKQGGLISLRNFLRAISDLYSTRIIYGYFSLNHPTYKSLIKSGFLPNPLSINLNLGFKAIGKNPLPNNHAIRTIDLDTFT